MGGVDILEIAVVLRLVNAMEPGMLSAMANVDKLEQKFQNLSKNANFHFSAAQRTAFNISKNMAMVGAGMTLVGVGAVAALKPMVEQAALMQKAMTNVQVATTGAIKSHLDFAKALVEVKRQSIGIGGATQFSAPEVAGFASKLATMGFHDPRMLTAGGVNNSLLMKVAQFAEAERQFRGVSPETSITSAGKIAGLLGMMNNPAQFKKALELVFQASMLTPASLPQIVTMMGQMGSVSSAMLKPNDRVMLTAFLGRISSGRQGNQLASMFARLIPNIFSTRSGGQMKALEAAGLIDKKGHLEYFDKKGEFIGMMPFLDLMEKKLGKLSTVQRQAVEQGIFGATGLKVFEPLMQPKNLQALKDMLAQQKKMISLQAAQKEMWDTFSGQVINLKTNFNSLLMTLGDHLLGPLTAVLKKINDIVLAVLDWAQTHQKLADILIKIAAVLAGIMIVVGPILMALGAMGMAVVGITGLVTAFGILGLTASAILVPLAAVAGVVALIVAGWRMWSSSGGLGITSGKAGAHGGSHALAAATAAAHIGARLKGMPNVLRGMDESVAQRNLAEATAHAMARESRFSAIAKIVGDHPMAHVPDEPTLRRIQTMTRSQYARQAAAVHADMRDAFIRPGYPDGIPMDLRKRLSGASGSFMPPYEQYKLQQQILRDSEKASFGTQGAIRQAALAHNNAQQLLRDMGVANLPDVGRSPVARHLSRLSKAGTVASALSPLNHPALLNVLKGGGGAEIGGRFVAIMDKLPDMMHLFTIMRVGIAGVGAVLGTLFTPLDLIIFAVQGLAQAVIHHWAEIRKTTSQTWKEVTRQIGVAFSVLNQYFGKGGSLVGIITTFFAIFQFITDEFERFFVGIWPGLATVFKGFWKMLQGILTVTVKVLLDILKTFGDLFSGNWSKLGDDLTTIWTDLWQGFGLIVSGAFDAFIKGPIEMIAGGITNVLDGVFNGFKEKVHGIAAFAAQLGGPQQGFFQSLANDTATAGPAQKPLHTSQAAWDAAQKKLGWAALPPGKHAAGAIKGMSFGSVQDHMYNLGPNKKNKSWTTPAGFTVTHDNDFMMPYGTGIKLPFGAKFLGSSHQAYGGEMDFGILDKAGKVIGHAAMLHMAQMNNFKIGQNLAANTTVGMSGIMPQDWARKMGVSNNVPHLCIVTDENGQEELVQVLNAPPVYNGAMGGGASLLNRSRHTLGAVDPKEAALMGGVHVHMAAGAVVLNGHPAPGHIVSAAEAALKKAAEVSFAHGPHSGATIHHPRPGGGV